MANERDVRINCWAASGKALAFLVKWSDVATSSRTLQTPALIDVMPEAAKASPNH